MNLSTSWEAELAQALETRDLDTIRRLPKTDLHCHGSLSAAREEYSVYSDRPVPPPPAVFETFAHFTQYLIKGFLPALTSSPTNVRALLRAALERTANDGVVYAEMSFDLMLPDFLKIPSEQFCEIVKDECEAIRPRLRVTPEIGVGRYLAPDNALSRVDRWLSTEVFRSIDLYDDEAINQGRVEGFVSLYNRARSEGLKLKAHAGELLGPETVRHALETLNLDAIQHGVRAVEDPELLELLAKRGTTLHVCPTSNVMLKVAKSLEEHPALKLHRSGVRITVNTDDYAIFGSSVSEEILKLTDMGFSTDEVIAVVRNGLEEESRLN
jgi:adenosine deaminase